MVAAGVVGLVLAGTVGGFIGYHLRGTSNAGASAPPPTPTATTTTAPAAQEDLTPGTIVVHVYGHRGGAHPRNFAWTEQTLLLTRLGPTGEPETAGAITTPEHTLHVPSGEFLVTVPGTPPQNGLPGIGQKVKISGAQKVSITITVPITSAQAESIPAPTTPTKSGPTGPRSAHKTPHK